MIHRDNTPAPVGAKPDPRVPRRTARGAAAEVTRAAEERAAEKAERRRIAALVRFHPAPKDPYRWFRSACAALDAHRLPHPPELDDLGDAIAVAGHAHRIYEADTLSRAAAAARAATTPAEIDAALAAWRGPVTDHYADRAILGRTDGHHADRVRATAKPALDAVLSAVTPTGRDATAALWQLFDAGAPAHPDNATTADDFADYRQALQHLDTVTGILDLATNASVDPLLTIGDPGDIASPVHPGNPWSAARDALDDVDQEAIAARHVPGRGATLERVHAAHTAGWVGVFTLDPETLFDRQQAAARAAWSHRHLERVADLRLDPVGHGGTFTH